MVTTVGTYEIPNMVLVRVLREKYELPEDMAVEAVRRHVEAYGPIKVNVSYERADTAGV